MWWQSKAAPEGPLDPQDLLQRCLRHARRAGADAGTQAGLAAFLEHPLTRAILELPESRLAALMVNDAYKPRMHKLYTRYMPGVVADFELWVRKTPAPLARIRQEDPQLWEAFLQECSRRLAVPPYPPEVVAAVDAHFGGFSCSQEMLERADRDGVAPVAWQELDGQLEAFSHGPIEASSHVETTLTQLVQELTVAAQVRALERERGIRLSPAELLASSLAKLAVGVSHLRARAQAEAAQAGAAVGQRGQQQDGGSEQQQQQQQQQDGGQTAGEEGGGEAGPPPAPAIMLFAGRRSTSRRFLVLQNWYCMCHMPGYQGTSAVLAVTVLEQLLGQLGLPESGKGAAGGQGAAPAGVAAPPAAPPEAAAAEAAQQAAAEQQAGNQQDGIQLQREQDQLPAALGCPPDLSLVGTLAHEVIMVADQLLGSFDDISASTSTSSSSSTGGPVQICSLLAHLLLLAAGGGVAKATALPDTFGTRGFVSAALAARLPEEFRQDIQEQYPDEWAKLPPAVRAEGARVFDLFSWWRMDSGEYEEMASYVVGAWEARWAGVPAKERPPRPLLMHSNLDGIDDILACWSLPPRIRPAAFAFGTLADGFLPFDVGPSAGQDQGQQAAGGQELADGFVPFDAGPLALDGPCPRTGAVSEGAAGQGGSQPSAAGSQGQAGPAGAAQPAKGHISSESSSETSQGGGAEGGPVEIKLCSVVMKAVQCSCPGSPLAPATESAGKLGDDASASKAQFDRRLPPDAQEHTKQRLLLLAREQPGLDSDAVSTALAAAYHAVTREGVLR